MPDTYSIAIFDRVRVRVAPETEAAGIAASVGQVYKVVRLSATGAKVIGQCNDDVAVSVHFDTRKETLWLAPELLEIVRSDRKAEAPIQWGRSENGKWLEILMPRKSPWWKFWSRKDVAVTTGWRLQECHREGWDSPHGDFPTEAVALEAAEKCLRDYQLADTTDAQPVPLDVGVYVLAPDGTRRRPLPETERARARENEGKRDHAGPHQASTPRSFDESKAKDYVGKTVLIGVSYTDHEGNETTRRQWYGTITEVSNARGIVIALKNDSTYCALPPDGFSCLVPAKPGEYRLHSTGEVIRNPDFLVTLTRKAPAPKAGGRSGTGEPFTLLPPQWRPSSSSEVSAQQK